MLEYTLLAKYDFGQTPKSPYTKEAKIGATMGFIVHSSKMHNTDLIPHPPQLHPAH